MDNRNEQKVYGRIIVLMKQRFQRDENFPISLKEILDELQEFDLNLKSRNNFDNNLLKNNPKLEVIDEPQGDRTTIRKYKYKPSYNIRNRKDLVNLVKDHQAKGIGGIWLDDIQESMTTNEFEKAKKIFGQEIIDLQGKGKKKVLYYNDKSTPENLQIEEDIVKYWRDVSVEGLDEKKIDEYLEKQGIASMQDAFAPKLQALPVKRKSGQKGRHSKKFNDHLGNILTEYNPDLIKK